MRIEQRDRELIQIVDAAMAEAALKSGDWLVCRPGCASCCLGPFLITQLDAIRLRQGLAELTVSDPERAERVRQRAQLAAAEIERALPNASMETILEADFADDQPCPALDPITETCDLYSSRPITCRIFGPPVYAGSESLGVCELCFEGATDEEIAQCEVEIDPDGLESELLSSLEAADGNNNETLVAFALVEQV